MELTRPDWTAAVQRTVLPNGLTVLIERDTSAPVVASVAHVRAGYFDEPDHWVGIAHVLEHMFFKGTARRPMGAMASDTQRLGGYLNAGTIYDKTVYYTLAPASPEVIERLVDIQSDGLRNAEIDPDELRRELEVIIQEAKRKLDSPAAVTVETLYELLFAQHPIRRWRIGTEDGLRALRAPDVLAYYRSRYVPERTILGLVGDLDPDRALEAVHERYGDWKSSAESIPAHAVETDPPAPQLRIMTGDVQRPQVALGWRTVDALHPDAIPLDVAASVLGSGRGSWLNRMVRSPGLASSAGAQHFTPTGVGVFDITLSGSAERTEQAVKSALGLVSQIGTDGPGEYDLERVRSLMAVGWARRLEGMETRALTFCQFEALGGLHLLNEWYDATNRVDADDVRRVANTYLDVSQVSGTVYTSRDDIVGFDAGTWPPTGAVVPVPSIEGADLPAPARRRAVQGVVHEDVCHSEFQCANLLGRSRRGTGLAHVVVYSPRLREFETESTAGLSALVTRTALRGTNLLDAEQLARAAERLGGTIVPVMLAGAVGWGITVRAGAVADAAGLLHHLVSRATLEDRHVEIERELQASDARRTEDDMYNYPVRRVLGLAYPGTCHGLPLQGDPVGIASVQPDAVREWMDKIRSRRLAVVAVGDLDNQPLVDRVSVFSQWSGAGASLPAAPGDWQNGRDHRRRDKAQTAIAMAFPAEPDGETRSAMLVLAALLSGLSGRLFNELREQRSLAYSVNATPWQRHTAGAMLAYIATSPEREQEARDAMLNELERVGDDELLPDELERAKRYVTGSMQLRMQSSSALASEIFEAFNRQDLAGLSQNIGRVEAVTATQVKQLAASVFVRDQRAEFVVRGGGPEA